jgi:hypothetical protein
MCSGLRKPQLLNPKDATTPSGRTVGKEGGATDAKPETKKANNYALNPKNKDGYDSKWQKGGATDAKPETKERLNYALNPKNKDGYDSRWQKGEGWQEGWRDGRESRDEGAPQLRPQPQEQGWLRLQVAEGCKAGSCCNTDELHHLQNGPATRPK